MVKLIFKMTFPIFCVCLMVFISLMPSQNPSVFNGFKVNGNHWTRHVKIFHPQFLCPINRQLSDILKFSIFQKMVKGTFYGFNNGYLGHLYGFSKIITFLKIMIFSIFFCLRIILNLRIFKTKFSAYSMKKDIEVTCGASKIDVRVNKNYFKEKRMDLRNIDQLTMSKNGTNCIPTYDRNTESYRFIIFAPFTMCNTQVVHETEGT